MHKFNYTDRHSNTTIYIFEYSVRRSARIPASSWCLPPRELHVLLLLYIHIQQLFKPMYICIDQTTAATTTSSPTSPTTSPSGCKPRTADCEDLADSSVCNMHGFCAGGYATVVCRKTCEICQGGTYQEWKTCEICQNGTYQEWLFSEDD